LDKHRDAHDQMNAQLMKLIDRNNACEANVQADVADFLANLWIKHIRVDDKRYKDFANSHK
jgi:hemerythrin